MRALIASDSIAGLPSSGVGDVIGRAFADEGAQVAVIPMATGGPALAEALQQLAPATDVVRPASLDAAIDVLRTLDGVTRFVDLTDIPGLDIDDVLASVLAAELSDLRSRGVADAVTVVARDSEAGMPLTGMSGVISTRGHERGTDLGDTLAADSRAVAWLQQVGTDDVPGAGAADGLAALFVSAGARVMSGVDACADAGRLDAVMGRADVVVTGAEQLDFHAVGGPIVREVSRRAGSALRPVIAVVGRCFVSPRELRLAGVESAYAVLDGHGEATPTPDQLLETARRVAATWRW